MLLLKPAGSTTPVACGGRVYHLTVPSVADRAGFARAVRVAGGRSHSRQELLALVERGVIALTDQGDPLREIYLGMIADARAAMQAAVEAFRDESMDPAERNKAMIDGFIVTDPALVDLAAMVEREYLPYREAVADNLVFADVQEMVSARLFLSGIEGGAAPFKRGMDGLDESVLASIPKLDLAAIRREVLALMEPPADEKKDSAGSPSGAGAPSPSTVTRKPAPKRRSKSAKAGTLSH